MSNPYYGIWGRKTSRVEDSWGIRYEEMYYSSWDDWDGESVTLRNYNKFGSFLGLKPKFLHERFDFLGQGGKS